MRLLVSPMNLVEAKAALDGGADIVDVKNPKEGSLGANFPWTIRAVADLARGRAPVSATIGDLDYKPGTASLAALGAASSGADYVKAGLLGIRTADQAEEMMTAIVAAMRPGARLFLVEFRGEDDHVPIKALHRMHRAQAVREMEAAGLEFDRSWNGLPWQHFLVFRKW